MNNGQENHFEHLAPGAMNSRRSPQSENPREARLHKPEQKRPNLESPPCRPEDGDEVGQSLVSACKTRSRTPTGNKESAASLSKDTQSIAKHDLSDVETMLSPTSAPKIKRLCTMPPVNDVSDREVAQTRAKEHQQSADEVTGEVRLSIATSFPPTDITVKKMYHISEINTMRKCNSVAAQDFLPEIYAAGFDNDLKVLAYRLQKIDYVPGSGTYDDDEEWIAVTGTSPNIFKKWVNSVMAGSDKNVCPCIQILVLDERSAEAYGTQLPLLTRAQKQKPVPGETLPVPSKEKQGGAAEVPATGAAPNTRKPNATAKNSKADAVGESEASAIIMDPKNNSAPKMLEQVKAENKDLKAEIKQLRKDKDFEIRNLTVELDYAKMQRDDRADEKAQLAEELEQAKKDMNKIAREKSKLKNPVDTLAKDLAKMALDLDRAYSAGYILNDGPAPSKEPYWAKYLPKQRSDPRCP